MTVEGYLAEMPEERLIKLYDWFTEEPKPGWSSVKASRSAYGTITKDLVVAEVTRRAEESLTP